MKFVGCLLALWLGCVTVASAAPNIVYILSDDMGYGDPQLAGGKAATPNLDRLAKEGMRFTDAHTSSSVCTPTRYGIMTGRYNWRSTLKQGVLSGNSPALIPGDRVTVPSFLKQAGYHTGFIGKWHLGLGWEKPAAPAKAESGPTAGTGWGLDYSKPVKNGPLTLGFDEDFFISASLDMPPFVYLKNDKAAEIPTVTKKWLREGPAAKDFEADHCLRDFAREARGFIKRAAASKEQPFFLYLPLTSPHTPIVPSENWKGKSPFGLYGDFLMETDWVVGELLAEIEASGTAADTIVIFTSDNGCSPHADIPPMIAKGHKPNGDWRGTKADIWEGGHRVPFLVRWPSVVKAGSTCATTICTTDLFATAAEVIGKSAAIPADAAEDSFSMLPLLRGEDGHKREFTIHHSINGSFAIRKGDWKLCLCPDSGGWSAPKPGSPESKTLYPVQLYNLKDDPREQTNLAEKETGKVKELSAVLAKAIHDGRTTPGPVQKNDGEPGTTPARVADLLPELQFMVAKAKAEKLED
ncbi:arylsulfatase [Luteolibacter ambystomatis]|uniref:Arylsulfatase n=1 Tax=Luteolibacter ambystomatis TaxID=2824561 RepID=A0A975IZQ3_9BACT|nr:arylsulfatase [Luteolibacter ambystomatis]QUE49980.1 arylsulfatase [Luteolibacter ambystomatis]